MSTEWNSLSLDSLGVLRARGADVVSFLQGQLSNDVALLGPERSLLAGYHNPQGRVIALLRLGEPSPGGGLAILRPARWLVLSSVGTRSANPPVAFAGCAPMQLDRWRRLAVAAGEPEIYAATSEEVG